MRRKYQRRLRHWKQQFDKDAKFIFSKPMFYAGKQYAAGARIPKALAKHKTKLRRFWESQVIELADFTYRNVNPDIAAREMLTLEGKKAKPRIVKGTGEMTSVQYDVTVKNAEEFKEQQKQELDPWER